jgi:hypothetical protein
MPRNSKFGVAVGAIPINRGYLFVWVIDGERWIGMGGRRHLRRPGWWLCRQRLCEGRGDSPGKFGTTTQDNYTHGAKG